MPRSVADRIQERLDDLGLKPTPASVAADLGKSGIRNILNGASKSPRLDTLAKIAPVLETTIEWLAEGKGPKNAPTSSRRELTRAPLGQEFSPDPEFDATLAGDGFAAGVPYRPTTPGARPEIDGRAGAGDGALGEARVVALRSGGTVTGHRVVGEWSIPTEVYRSEFHASPADVFVFAVRGESMRPTLEPGDRIFIDGGERSFSTDGVYLIDDGDGEPRVKRLQKVLFSNPPEVVVISDNKSHGEQTVRLEALRVLGRVCGRLTRM